VAADVGMLPNNMADWKARFLRQLKSQQCHSSGDDNVDTSVDKTQSTQRTDAMAGEISDV